MDDMTLLREYAARNSEAAFEELVSRRIGFVHSAALRQVRDPHLAEEITQVVFTILAQKAGRIPEKAILTGWLFKATRFTALAQIRAATKRRQCQQEVQMQSEFQSPAADDVWSQMSPLLDEALATLGETDRQAVLLRFFDDKSLAEVGHALGTGEDTARKRVARALEKLRKFFSKRGVASTPDIIAGTISANSVQAAPAALAKFVAAVAIAKGASAGASTLTLIKGALKLMAWAKMKTAILVGAGVLLAAGAGTVLVEKTTRPPDIQGAWEGTLEYSPPQKERLVFKIFKDNGSYRATGDFIDMGIKDVLFNKFVYNRPSVHFENNLYGDLDAFIYEATLNPDMSEMSGTWKRHGVSGQMILKRTNQPDTVPDKLKESDYAPRTGSDLQGFWAGMVKAGTNSWLLYFKIAEQPDGTYRAEADGIIANVKDWIALKEQKPWIQGVKNLPANSVTYNRPSVKLEFSSIAETFQGEINSDRSEMTGTWGRGNTTVPLTMKRADPNSEDSRLMTVVGIGVSLDMDKQTGAIRITQVVPNSPAARAGLTAGVIIQKIDGVSIAGKASEECAMLIRGMAIVGTKVRLQLVIPDKNETNTVELTRQIIYR